MRLAARRLCLAAALLCLGMTMWAQEPAQKPSEGLPPFVVEIDAEAEAPALTDADLWERGIAVHFPQSKITVKPGDKGIEQLEAVCRRLASDGFYICRVVVVRGSASPEGTQQFNELLSRRRGEVIAQKIIDWGLAASDSTQVGDILQTTQVVEDYYGLRRLMENTTWAYAPRVIKAIDEGGGDIRKTKRLIRALDDNYIWMRLVKLFFPELRASRVVIVVSRPPEPKSEIEEPEETPEDTVVPAEEQEETEPLVPADAIDAGRQKHGWPLAVHTNMLYDAVTVPNLGLEVMLMPHLSLAVNWQYAWWDSEARQRSWRTYGGYAALRYYFGQRTEGSEKYSRPMVFRGHHLGLYGQVMLYDFEWNGHGYLSGIPRGYLNDKPTFGGGMEYGYTMPLARRLSLDFTLGLGYLGGQYQEYRQEGCRYLWQATKRRNWFGPTRLEVNLVWLLGRGNVNIKKGGKQ